MAGDPAPVVRVDAVSHCYGRGELRRQVLFDVSVEIRAGEIVILTGPSGSGKTTLLTLIGALRSAQSGSLHVLGAELRDAAPRALEGVRRRIGYIFQSHNLIDALTASQNVQMGLLLDRSRSRAQIKAAAEAMLAAVGLEQQRDHHPARLSGGQRQRVAIARALVRGPRLILADEPTASLDRESGREVVELVRGLARDQGVAVVLVTHDNRILDVADRILHLEDGRLRSFASAVLSNTRHMLERLAQSSRSHELRARVADLSEAQFLELLRGVTDESRDYLNAAARAEDEAFESMLAQALDAFACKISQILGCERTSLFLVDRERRELSLTVAQEERGAPLAFRMPLDAGIAGRVATTGQSLLVRDAYAEPLWNPALDRETGFRTRSVLCVPLRDGRNEVFAVAQLLNRADGQPFDSGDEKRFGELAARLGVILESWWHMRSRHGPRVDLTPPVR